VSNSSRVAAGQVFVARGMWTEAFAIREAIYQTVSLVLWLISQVKETLTNVDEISKYCRRALAPGQPVEFDHLLLAGLKPATQAAYVKELVAFQGWLERVHLEPRFPSELDAAVNRYLSEVPGPPSRVVRLLAALEKAFPLVRGRLAWFTRVFFQSKKTIAVALTFTMPYEVALMLAYQMAVSGWARVGGVLLLQWLHGLRPSEALGLSANVLDSAAMLYLGVLRPACLLLAPKRGTKSGRPQHAQGRQSAVAGRTRVPRPSRPLHPRARSCVPLSSQHSTSVSSTVLRRLCGPVDVIHRIAPEQDGRVRCVSGVYLSRSCGKRTVGERIFSRFYLDSSATLQLQCDEQHIRTFARWLHEDLDKRFPWWH